MVLTEVTCVFVIYSGSAQVLFEHFRSLSHLFPEPPLIKTTKYDNIYLYFVLIVDGDKEV